MFLGGLFFEWIQTVLILAGYVSGNATFPKPLNKSEEKKYLDLYAKGDESAKNVLIEHNLRLVAHIAKKYQMMEADMEELVSIGAVGLIKAVDTFDQEKASKLATYAARCVENEILMYLRVRKKISRESSYYEPIGTDKEGNEIRLLDIMESQDPEALDVIELKDDTRKIYTLLDRVLTPRERQVLIMRYGLYQGKEYTQREIAEELGISRSYISRIEKNALQRLREHFQD